MGLQIPRWGFENWASRLWPLSGAGRNALCFSLGSQEGHRLWQGLGALRGGGFFTAGVVCCQYPREDSSLRPRPRPRPSLSLEAPEAQACKLCILGKEQEAFPGMGPQAGEGKGCSPSAQVQKGSGRPSCERAWPSLLGPPLV